MFSIPARVARTLLSAQAAPKSSGLARPVIAPGSGRTGVSGPHEPGWKQNRAFPMALKFRGVDFIAFDTLLTDDERLVRDTARKFIEDNLIPIIEECNRAGRFPRELVRPMGELGFFGASLKDYGCAGMSNVEYGLVMQELERGGSGVRSFVSVQSALVMFPIYTFGSDQQKD